MITMTFIFHFLPPITGNEDKSTFVRGMAVPLTMVLAV
jgi:hypothetical protein